MTFCPLNRQRKEWGRPRNTRKRAATRIQRSAVVSIRNIATETEKETVQIGMALGIKINGNAPGPRKGAKERAAAKVTGVAGSRE